MDIKSAEKSFQDVAFGEDSYEQLLDYLKNDLEQESYHLCLLIGKTDDRKETALQQIARQSSREVYNIDANNIISKIESESYKNTDRIFKKFTPEDTLLYLNNGSRLCGSYTGFTQSNVKYATPQERYFLKKVQQVGGLYVVDIATDTDADATIRRAAQSIINFPKPQSGFKKLLWRLKQVGVHGHEIKADRPEHYDKQSGNF